MTRRLLIVETALVLCLPLVEACAKGGQPYLPKPSPHLYSNPKAYEKDCTAAKLRHQQAVQKAGARKEGGETALT